MEYPCITGLDDLPEAAGRCVLTIGNFDGVHLGHQRIVSAAALLAAGRGAKAVALTFNPPPDLIINPGDRPERIVPHERKCELLLAAGADLVVSAHTDDALLAMAPGEFMRQIVVKKFRPSCVVEGENFFFGLGRSGNVETLRDIGAAEGFDVEVVEPVSVDLSDGAARISSTLIRRLVSRGRIEDAGLCLGRPFALYGEVVAGRGLGRELDFPTANILAGQQVTPADGVYAGRAAIGERSCPAAISIGVKPTVGPTDRTIEAFLIDTDRGAGKMLYGEAMTLSFIQRLRDQVKFEDIDALRAQIAKDVEHVRSICE